MDLGKRSQEPKGKEGPKPYKGIDAMYDRVCLPLRWGLVRWGLVWWGLAQWGLVRWGLLWWGIVRWALPPPPSPPPPSGICV